MFLTPAKIAAAVRRQSAWLLLLLCAAGPAAASDHLDTPTVISDPRADIGDLYAWMSPDGRRLNLVMTVVGRAFDDALTYSFHIDSGQRVGATVSTVTLSCHGLAGPASNSPPCGRTRRGRLPLPCRRTGGGWRPRCGPAPWPRTRRPTSRRPSPA